MKTFVVSIKAFLLLTALTGILYPLLVTGIAQVFFPKQANGSLIYLNGRATGSELIGQYFDSTIYFSSRPSTILYNPIPSGGSNYGLTNVKLKEIVNEREIKFIAENSLDSLTAVPSEMLFASASGIDPHISPEAAILQADRISRARGFNTEERQKLNQLISNQTEPLQFLCLGQERINVLLLNLEIDRIK